MCLLSFLKWGSIGYSLGIVQWDFTRRDHPGNPGRVFGSGPVMICHGCELEISGTLLTVVLRIMDMSEFDVILGMDWLTAYRVVIDCERRRVTAYTQDGTRVVFKGDKHDILP